MALVTAATGARADETPEPDAPEAEEHVGVEPPRLLQQHEATYPPPAKEAGLEADVVLELLVGADGKVADSVVVEPAGHGFDEAAREASLHFLFAPALRDGRPVAALIHYRYLFRIAPTEPAAPEPTPPAQTAGRLHGKIVTGSPPMAVAGAEVLITLPDGTTRELLTDAAGIWQLDEAEPGRYRIAVRAPGFEPIARDAELAAGGEWQDTSSMEPAGVDSPEEQLEVSVEGERPAREVTRRTLSKRELETMPGSMGDALRAVQSLPGVAPTYVGSQQIVVRGTDPADTVAYIDGMYVMDIYHLWGLSSVVPTEMLDHLDLYPGNYSVKYGRGKGGLVEAGLRDPIDDGHTHGFAQLDLIDARLMLEGPVPGMDGYTYIGAVRRSHLDAIAMPALGWPVTPVYNDYQFFVVTHPTPDSRLRLGVLGANDRFTYEDEDDVSAMQLDSRSGFFYLSSVYEARLSEEVDWTHTLAVGHIYRRFSYSSADDSFHVDAPAYPIGTRTELGWRFLPGLRLNLGTDIHYAPYRVELRLPEQPASQSQQTARTAFQPLAEVDTTETHLQPAAYAELVATPTAAVRVIGGFRVDYYRTIDHVDVSPRLSARYDVVQAPERTTIKGGIGLFTQPPPPELVLPGFGTPGLRSSRAIQSSVGVEQTLGDTAEASLEGFTYHLSDLIRRDVSPNGELEYENSGEGITYGLETLLRIKPASRFYGWLAYTLSRSLRRQTEDDPLVVASTDVTHILTVLGSYRLGRGWEAGAKFQYVSGTPYTPTVGAVYSSTTNEYLRVRGEPNSARLPAFHELDLRVEKRWALGDSVTLTTYLDLINVYGKDRVLGERCSDDLTRCDYNTHPMPMIPSLGVRGEF